MTIIVNKPQATFIHIPKTGGVSISRWLVSNASGSHLSKGHGGKHAEQRQIQKYMDQKNIDMGFTFCVVRNPWDRLVSAYHYYNGKSKKHKIDVSFEKFVYGEWKNAKCNPWGCATKPMHVYYDDIDYILRFENLNGDFKKIQEFFGKSVPLQKHNSSQHKDFRSYYDSQMVDYVAQECAKDIELYGYTFE